MKANPSCWDYPTRAGQGAACPSAQQPLPHARPRKCPHALAAHMPDLAADIICDSLTVPRLRCLRSSNVQAATCGDVAGPNASIRGVHRKSTTLQHRVILTCTIVQSPAAKGVPQMIHTFPATFSEVAVFQRPRALEQSRPSQVGTDDENAVQLKTPWRAPVDPSTFYIFIRLLIPVSGQPWHLPACKWRQVQRMSVHHFPCSRRPLRTRASTADASVHTSR